MTSSGSEDSSDVRGAFRGLLIALPIAIPLWAMLLALPELAAHNGHIGESASLALMLAATGMAILLRPRARDLLQVLRRVADRSPGLPSSGPAAPPLMRQALALSGLAGAYLQYYFLDVYLQIAALNSLTVFVPVNSLT